MEEQQENGSIFLKNISIHIRKVDQAIEEWIQHMIRQIEEEN